MMRYGQIHKQVARYVFALALAVAAFALTVSATPLHATPYLISAAAVLAAAFLAGVGPAVLAAVVSLAAVEIWIYRTLHSPHPVSEVALHPLRMLMFVVVAALACWVAYHREQSQQRLSAAEIAHRRSEERFEKAFYLSPDALIISRAGDGTILDANASFLKLIGRTADEVIGKRSTDLALGVDPAARSAEVKQVLTAGHVRDHFRQLRTSTGETRDVVVQIVSIELHGEKGLLTIMRDVTDQKRADDELKRLASMLQLSDERFRLALKGSPVTVFNYDRDLRFTWVYNPISDLAGVDLVGKTDFEIMERAEEADAVTEIKRRVLLTGQGERHEIVMHLGGVPRHYDLLVEPLRDSAGTVEGLTCASIEITDRKRAEVEREQSQQALLRSEKLATAGRLAATIAHEINNPLSAVTNLLYLAVHDPNLSPETRERLTTAELELRRAVEMAKRTLSFYRDERKTTRFDAAKLVRDVLTLFEPTLRGRNIRVLTRFTGDSEIEGNSSEVRQVLANLIANASDAMTGEGYLQVRVSAKNYWRGSGNAVRITIADTGTGIAPEHRRRIFEPFFTTKGSVGTGLGLGVTQEIVHRHGGTMRLRSKPGAGTAFTVWLPARPATAEGDYREGNVASA